MDSSEGVVWLTPVARSSFSKIDQFKIRSIKKYFMKIFRSMRIHLKIIQFEHDFRHHNLITWYLKNLYLESIKTLSLNQDFLLSTYKEISKLLNLSFIDLMMIYWFFLQKNTFFRACNKRKNGYSRDLVLT